MPGTVGAGFSFGNGNFIDVPDAPSLSNQQFTVEAWVRADGPGSNNDDYGSVVIQKGVNANAGTLSIWWSALTGRFRLGFGIVGTDEIQSQHTFASGQFHHVAASYDGTAFKLFVDGALEAQAATTRTVVYSAVPWSIGSTSATFRSIGFPRTWNGVIDEVSIYSRALSPSEIQSIVSAAASGKCQGPVTTPSNAIALPDTLSVVLGQTQPVVVTIGPATAPAGGVPIALTSTADAVAHVETSPVVVPAGTTTATATIRGAGPGLATIAATSPGFAGSQTTVTVTGALNILESNISFADRANANMTVRLEGAGVAIPAPTGGYAFALASANPACVSVQASGTIPAGASSVTATLASGGTATLPCTTTITVSGAKVTGDSVGVTVTPAITALQNITGPGTTMVSYFNPAAVVGGLVTPAFPFAAVSFFNPPQAQAPVLTPSGAAGSVSFFNPAPVTQAPIVTPSGAANAVSFFNPETTSAAPVIVPTSAASAVSYHNGADPSIGGAGTTAMPSGTAAGVTFAAGPTVILVSPKEVSRSANVSYQLVLSGANLGGATSVIFSDPTGITVSPFTVSADGTTLSMPILVSPSTPLATLNVSVTMAGGGTTAVTADTVLKIVP